MPEYLIPVVALIVLLLALDATAARWGDDSRQEFEDRNW